MKNINKNWKIHGLISPEGAEAEGDTMSNLTIHELPVADCWKDMARIPKDYRRTESGDRIKRNTICKVTIGRKSKKLALRGSPVKEAQILLDSPTRHELEVQVGQSYDVKIQRVRWLGYWQWAWSAADPSYRLTAQISLISLALGVIGLLLGALSLWPIVGPWLKTHGWIS
jgi:hypothetical protein